MGRTPRKAKTENSPTGEIAATGNGTGTGHKHQTRQRRTRTDADEIEGKAITDCLRLFAALPQQARWRVMSYVGSKYGLSVTTVSGELGGEITLSQFPAQQSRTAAG